MKIIGYANIEILKTCKRTVDDKEQEYQFNYIFQMPIGAYFSQCREALQEMDAYLVEQIKKTEEAKKAEAEPEVLEAELVV